MTVFSLNSYGISCPKSFDGIKSLSKEKRLECTLYKIGILERYLDDDEGYEWGKGREDIAKVVKRLKGMESKVRGRYENYCMTSLVRNRTEKKKCLEGWRESIR